MFNVTVLKMRDIFKVIIGITFLVVVVLGISKIFHKDTKENSKGVQKIENGIRSNHKLELEKISTAYFINNTSNKRKRLCKKS